MNAGADGSLTMTAFVRRGAAVYGARDVLVTASERLTYADLEIGSRRLASALLGSGFGPRSRIAFLLPNGPQWLITFAAITRIGAVAVPASTFYQAAELDTFLRHASAEAIIVTDTMGTHDLLARVEQALPSLATQRSTDLQLDEVPLLRAAILFGDRTRAWATAERDFPTCDEATLRLAEDSVKPEDVLTVIYTSGTTAQPKGVIHAHGAALTHAATLARVSGLSAADRVWTPLPLFWVGGLAWGLLRCMSVGAALITQELFDPAEAVALIHSEAATSGDGWLPVMRRVVDAARGRLDLLASVSGGDLRVAMDMDLGIRPPGVPLGMTETFGPHTYREAADLIEGAPHRDEPGGRAIPGIEHRIVDPETGAELSDGMEGSIAVRGAGLMVGMQGRQRHELFDPRGWYVTGDLGYRDGPWVIFTGRSGDLIKSRGSNVAPAEVEAALVEQDAVGRAFVFGIACAEHGADVVAVLVPAPGTGQIDIASLRSRLAGRLSNFKVPAEFVVVEPGDLPMTPSLKVDRRALRAAVASRLIGHQRRAAEERSG